MLDGKFFKEPPCEIPQLYSLQPLKFVPMQALRDILRDRRFWWLIAGTWALQLLLLGLTTPLYEIDTNSFIRGGLSWDIYHNPLLNLLIAACSKVWASAYLIVAVQLAVAAFSGIFLARVLFGRGGWAFWIALGLVALEPVSLFYHFSLLSESLFSSFTLLSVAFVVLWVRHSGGAPAFLAGFAMGLAFVTKLSAITHLPLLAIFLLRSPRDWQQRIGGLSLAVMPFVGCYAFVYLGQQVINDGDLYTVEGRVRWDFASSMYDSNEVQAPAFKRFVHPYLYRDGAFVAHREVRRELTYLGYKDCVAGYEAQGHRETFGINACDSLFGAAATQVMARHFWAAEAQFIRDNVYFVHHLNYLETRFTPGLHHYYSEAEWGYLDSLMSLHYGLDLSQRSDRIPGIWKSLSFGNSYMPIWWWAWWLGLATAAWLAVRRKEMWELLTLAGLVAIPLLMNLVYISYRPRFLAPYLVLVGMLLLWEARVIFSKSKPQA
jgi:hypothetical protein